MAADTPGGDLQVAQRQTAEGDNQIAMGFDLLPEPLFPVDAHRIAQHQIVDHLTGGRGIGVDRPHIAAEGHIKKPMYLALRMMKPPGRGPAVGAAEHMAPRQRAGGVFRLRPVLRPEFRPVAAPQTHQFPRRQIQRRIPVELYIVIRAAPRVRPRTVCQPAPPHQRLCNPCRMIERIAEISKNARRMRIPGERRNIQPPPQHPRTKRAPVAGVVTVGHVLHGDSFAVSWVGLLGVMLGSKTTGNLGAPRLSHLVEPPERENAPAGDDPLHE